MTNRDAFRNITRYLFALVAWSGLVALWSYVWIRYYNPAMAYPLYWRGSLLVQAVYALLVFFFINLYGGFRIGYHKWGALLYSGLLALTIANTVTYFQVSLLIRALSDVRPILVMTVTQAAFFLLWSYIAHKIYVGIFAPRALLMIYGGEKLAGSLYMKMSTYPENYAIQESIDVQEGMDTVYARIAEYKNVILCDIPTPHRNALLKHCFDRGVRTYTTPKLTDIMLRGASEIDLFDTPLLLNRNSGLRLEQRILKRIADIVLAGTAAVIALPFLPFIAAAIKLWDRGPVLYKQTRLTRGSRSFTLYKFRSMIIDAEANGAQLATENDARVTPVGRVLRRVRLDELPQLYNILKGDMSVVGPRPERPEIAEQYQQTIPEFEYRLKVKAGLTGYAQIFGKYNTTPYDKLKLDLMYISNYSFLEDIKLILMTFKIIFMKDSTEGIAADALTAEVKSIDN